MAEEGRKTSKAAYLEGEVGTVANVVYAAMTVNMCRDLAMTMSPGLRSAPATPAVKATGPEMKTPQ